MGPYGVKVFLPTFGQYFHLSQGAKQFSVEEFISHTGVEAFTVAIFPRASRLNIGCGDTNSQGLG